VTGERIRRQHRSTGRSGARLEVRPRWYHHPDACEANAQRGRDRFGLVGLGRGPRPQAVIDVRGRDRTTRGAGEYDKSRRIGSPRECTRDGRAGRWERAAGKQRLDQISRRPAVGGPDTLPR
jgi:hypothetical protein